MFRFSCRWIDCWNAELQLKCKQICIRCMHKTLQYLFCAHLLVKKRWTEKFAFLSGEKKATHRRPEQQQQQQQTMIHISILLSGEKDIHERKKIAHSLRCIGRCTHFTIIRFRCSMFHRHPVWMCTAVSWALPVLCCALLCYAIAMTILYVPCHTMAWHALSSCTHWLTVAHTSSDKKDICFVAQNLTGVEKKSWEKTHTHTDRFIFSIPTTRKDEKR